MPSRYVKLVVFIPVTHADQMRQVLAAAGAGQLGHYNFCSFSSRGEGRFRGDADSHPAIGQAGKLATVAEEKIEVIVPRNIIKDVLNKVRTAHPYEEPALDVYALEAL